jgi:hypothetical protein
MNNDTVLYSYNIVHAITGAYLMVIPFTGKSHRREVKRMSDQPTQTLAATNSITEEVLANVNDFAAARQAAINAYGQVFFADESMGSGYKVLNSTSKDILCNVPIAFLSWTFNQGDNGEFVTAYVIVEIDGNTSKYIVNDGGNGIYKQLKEFTDEHNVNGGLFVRHGLRKSDYMRTNDEGKNVNRTTYYINTSR